MLDPSHKIARVHRYLKIGVVLGVAVVLIAVGWLRVVGASSKESGRWAEDPRDQAARDPVQEPPVGRVFMYREGDDGPLTAP
jgi:hypothetical protein